MALLVCQTVEVVLLVAQVVEVVLLVLVVVFQVYFLKNPNWLIFYHTIIMSIQNHQYNLLILMLQRSLGMIK